MSTSTAASIFQSCDFCHLQGVLEQNIFNKDGWYFCKPCLMEIEYELKKRKAENLMDPRVNN
jgi:hypothetical protein